MMLRRLLGKMIVLVAVFGMSTAGYAADVKIGVVDIQTIMKKSPAYQELSSQLQSKFKPRQEKLMAAETNLQNEIQDFTKNQAVMKPDELGKLKNKIIGDKKTYDAQVDAFRNDVALEKNKQFQNFMEKVQAAIGVVGKQGQFNFVFYRAAVPYVDANAADLTQEVLASMNKS